MLNFYFKLVRNFFSIIGLFICVALLLFLFFGETSKGRRDIFFDTLKSFVGIGPKYSGFIANTPSKYMDYIYLNVSNRFIEHDFNTLHLIIAPKNLASLEKMRKSKYDNIEYKKKWLRGKILILKSNNLKQSTNIKIRPKGDRDIHFLNLDSMSYKIDVREKNEFIFGMEEMSLQKPVTRNYAWEILYQELLRKENILSLKIIPVKLFRNGKYLGIFVLEEGFSNELLLKQARKVGPIFGINEDSDHTFPNLEYELYSENFWKSKFPKILIKSKKNLDLIKSNYQNDEFQISNYFDEEKWAKYFALSDVLKMFHGTVTKSVKLYYNPVSGLFEPIAFDGHYQSGYQNFSFIDFIENPEIKCGYACNHKNWYSLFFDKKNISFLEKYISYMDLYTSDKYQQKILDYSKTELNEINNFFYSEYQGSDRIFFKGMLPYYFDISTVKRRSDILRQKIFKNKQKKNTI